MRINTKISSYVWCYVDGMRVRGSARTMSTNFRGGGCRLFSTVCPLSAESLHDDNDWYHHFIIFSLKIFVIFVGLPCTDNVQFLHFPQHFSWKQLWATVLAKNNFIVFLLLGNLFLLDGSLHKKLILGTKTHLEVHLLDILCAVCACKKCGRMLKSERLSSSYRSRYKPELDRERGGKTSWCIPSQMHFYRVIQKER